jgi:large subunit ribosomal protein L29
MAEMTTANDLRQMKPEELVHLAKEQREAQFNLALKLRTGHLENSALLEKSRRDLARLLTVQREAGLGIARAYKAGLPQKGSRKAAAEAEATPKAKKSTETPAKKAKKKKAKED